MKILEAYKKLEELENTISLLSRAYTEVFSDRQNQDSTIEVLPTVYRRIKDIPQFIQELNDKVNEHRQWIHDNTIHAEKSIFEAVDTNNPEPSKLAFKALNYKGEKPFNHLLDCCIKQMQEDFIKPIMDNPDRYSKLKKIDTKKILERAKSTVKFLEGLQKILADADSQALACLSFALGNSIKSLYLEPFIQYPATSIIFVDKKVKTDDTMQIIADYIEKNQCQLTRYYSGDDIFKWHRKSYPEIKGSINKLIELAIYKPLKKANKIFISARALTHTKKKYREFIEEKLNIRN